MKEFDLIKKIQKQLSSSPEILVHSGDDMAIIKTPTNIIGFSTDMLVDKVHFDIKKDSPYSIGKKAVNVNISDCCAMGILPKWITVGVSLPKGANKYIEELIKGMIDACNRHKVIIVGGDITASNILCICIAIIGIKMKNISPVLRTTANVGDMLCITGSLGGSILGKHLHFEPPVKLVRELLKNLKITAMIDITDGLISELYHMGEGGKIGFVIQEEKIPISQDAKILSERTKKSPFFHALYDGEDFELLFCVADTPKNRKKLAQKFPDIHIIGKVIDKPGVYLQKKDGKVVLLRKKGYEHTW